jgi:integrase
VNVPLRRTRSEYRWSKRPQDAEDDDFVFPSEKLNGEQPRSASQLVEDHIRPAAIAAGVIKVENGVTYDRDGEIVKRFGFHNLGRHLLATFLMDEQENPALVQAIMRHAKMDMTLYYSHSRRKAKRAAQERVLQHLIPAGNAGANAGAGDDPVIAKWFGNLCIMMNLPHQSGRLTQR